jgi:hypothetical protein
MQNITEDPLSFLEGFLNQFPDHPDPAGQISELPELGAVETSEPAQIKDFLPAGRSETGPVKEIDQARYIFLMAERTRLLTIIRSSPITNQENGACYVACKELDKIHEELEEWKR